MKRRSLPWTQENSAERAISFETGRVTSGKSGNWMIWAEDGGSGSARGAESFITAPRRSRLARKAGSLIVAAMDKSSWVSIPFLYAECFVRWAALAGWPALVICIYEIADLRICTF